MIMVGGGCMEIAGDAGHNIVYTDCGISRSFILILNYHLITNHFVHEQ